MESKVKKKTTRYGGFLKPSSGDGLTERHSEWGSVSESRTSALTSHEAPTGKPTPSPNSLEQDPLVHSLISFRSIGVALSLLSETPDEILNLLVSSEFGMIILVIMSHLFNTPRRSRSQWVGWVANGHHIIDLHSFRNVEKSL